MINETSNSLYSNKKRCNGCHACFSICPKKAISMEYDIEGFFYPHIEQELCINCKLCKKTCPIVTGNTVGNIKEQIALACYNKDNEIRINSSSGGIFYLFAKHVIDNGGVVFGAEFDKDFNVIHGYAEKLEEVNKFMGSKYLQSRISDTYKRVKEFLLSSRIVLFSGTPCQIGGLKAFLNRDYDNLICIDFICHGVPSPILWKKYLKELSVQKIKSINFRNKEVGWKNFSIKVIYEDGSFYCKSHKEDIFMRGFLGDLFLRPSCYECNFKTLDRQSDLTLADFWGIQEVIPDMDTDRGTSLVLINSSVGYRLFEALSEAMVYKRVEIKEAIAYNPNAFQPVYEPRRRKNLLNMLSNSNLTKQIQKNLKNSFTRRVITRLINIGGL
jgi:coenzyme F420-reducing hydrogenase beta subunit